MTENNHATDEGLVRAIGTWALGANVINLVVGAGIFTLPGIVAAQLGPAALFAYLACAVIVGMIFLCYAEVGSRVTRSGGSYAYIEEAFGPFAGFVASTLLWMGWSVFGDAALAVAMTNALSVAVPILDEGPARTLFIVAVFSFLAIMNIVGLKSGMRLMIITTIGKLVPLLLLVSVGIFAIKFENLVVFELPSIENFGAAVLFLFFAFGGAETALNASGEIRDPEKTIPRGLLLGVGGVFILYVAIQLVSQGTLGPDLADNTEAPLTATANAIFGSWGAQLLLLGMIISIFGTLSGDVLNTPRVIYSSARDGLLPGILARVHPKFKTPYVAILFYAAAGCGLALTGSFRELIVVATGAILLVYLGVCLSVIVMRRRYGPPSAGQFRIPGGPVVPLLSSAVIIWLLVQMTAKEALGAGALLAVTILIYGVRKVVQKSRTS
jgi:amino acid transporter